MKGVKAGDLRGRLLSIFCGERIAIMIKTLLIYDGRMSSAERIADKLCYLIGNAMVSEITEAPSDLTPYDGFCFVFNF